MFIIKKYFLRFVFMILCVLSVARVYSVRITNPQIHESVLQSDGKLVLVGSVSYPGEPQTVIVRYNTDGSLDTTFANRGFVVLESADQSSVSGVAIQSDGKIVVAGYTQSGDVPNFLVARYDTDGTIDSTFGTNGVATTLIGDGAVGTDVGIQSTGEIVVSGFAKFSGVEYFAVARYASDGTLDNGYGENGIVTTLVGSNSQTRAIIVRPDDTVVVGGTAQVNGNNQFALTQYTTSGVLDTSFNGTGIVTTAIGSNDQVNVIKLQSTGEVVAAGVSDGKFALARYTTTGVLDTTYNGTGTVVTDLGGYCLINNIAIDSLDKVVVGGSSSDGLITAAKYTTSGSLDATFGVGGVLVFRNLEGDGMTVVIQSDGKMVATGVLIAGYIIGRFWPNGMLDVTYGSNGVTQQSTPPVAFVSNLWEEQPKGTNGGTFTGGSWQTRNLNKVVGDIFNMYINSNQINLDVGKYYITVMAPAFGVGRHQVRLQNLTFGKTEKYGSSAYSGNTQIGAKIQSSCLSYSVLQHTFIVPASSVYTIQHFSEQDGVSTGFGLAADFAGNSEVYTQVQIHRLF